MDILNLNETAATVILGLIIIAAFTIPYILSTRKKEREMKQHQEEAIFTGTNKPLMQHPLFDLAACIGCGVCTQVCPEGKVLGVINGKVAIINGAHCVGHGECARHCPVGAINIGLGDISTREDIPQLSEGLETTVPNIFIAGELGGLALIRNAIDQGVKAVDSIALQLGTPAGDHEILIAGAGPAGLAASLRCIELGLKYQVIDQDYPGGTILNYPRKKLTLVQPVSLPLHGRLNNKLYSKEDLLEIWDKLITTHKINLKTAYKLLSIDPADTGYTMNTSGGKLHASHVILAMGRRGTPRKLNVPGEELPKVMYKLIDAAGYRNNHLLVVGGGDSAIEAAMGLASQRGNTVTISYRKEAFFRIKKRNSDLVKSKIRNREIKVLYESSVKEILPGKVLLEQQDQDLEIKNDYTFVFVGGLLPFGLLNDMGIRFGKKVEKMN